MSSVVNTEKSKKIANVIALAIEEDIIEQHMSVGMPLATEAELCQRYGASRWAIREALAIVQNDGLVEVRRGRGGGAVVSATPAQSLAAAMCGFLLYAQMENEHIIQARVMIDRLLFDAARVNQVTKLENALAMLSSADTISFRRALAGQIYEEVLALSGTTVTSVFALALSKLTLCRLSLLGMDAIHIARPEISYRIVQLRFVQLRAFVGLDATASFSASLELADMFRRLFGQCSPLRVRESGLDRSRAIAATIAEIVRPEHEAKAAGILSTLLMLDAMARKNEDGYLGSEAELTARYGVPRNMLREGIRILERDGFVRTEQGRSGGIRIGEPDEAEIVSRATSMFRFARPPRWEIVSLLRECRMASLEAVMMQSGSEIWFDATITALKQAGGNGMIDDLFHKIAHYTGNSCFIIIEKICTSILSDRKSPVDEVQWIDQLHSATVAKNLPMSQRLVAILNSPEAGH